MQRSDIRELSEQKRDDQDDEDRCAKKPGNQCGHGSFLSVWKLGPGRGASAPRGEDVEAQTLVTVMPACGRREEGGYGADQQGGGGDEAKDHTSHAGLLGNLTRGGAGRVNLGNGFIDTGAGFVLTKIAVGRDDLRHIGAVTIDHL